MYAPNFLDGYDRLVAFDAETTGKHTPSAEFVRKQPFAWKPPGLVIEVGFVEMLRVGEGWRPSTRRRFRSTRSSPPIRRIHRASRPSWPK
jgi:ATP-dependent DNA ligase